MGNMRLPPEGERHDPINEERQRRSPGIVKAISVGMTDSRKLLGFAQEGDFDCFLLAGRYTLLDQSALAEFLLYCYEHNIGIILGGAYNSGILAFDLGPDAQYEYRVAPPEILEKARRIRGVCARYNVPAESGGPAICACPSRSDLCHTGQ